MWFIFWFCCLFVLEWFISQFQMAKWPKKKKKDYLELFSYFIALFIFVVLCCLAVQHFEVTFLHCTFKHNTG